MRSIHVADVGDGLCAAIKTIPGGLIQVDCGGRNAEIARRGWERTIMHRWHHGQNAFVISHFHIDHYNGLLAASLKGSPWCRIEEVYYPRIPEFKDREKFILYCCVMNMRVFGSQTGCMEYDFLKAISRVSECQFKYRALCKGDKVKIRGIYFNILWPPRLLKEDQILVVVDRALSDFEKALEDDKETRRLYERVGEEGVFRKYALGEGEVDKYEGQEYSNFNTDYKPHQLPKSVVVANSSLRKASNRLSLAFLEDSRLLFLGDTEGFEIRQIVSELIKKDRRSFYAFITPHHGTHWHKILEGMRFNYSISSNGAVLCSKMVQKLKFVSDVTLSTWANGDILIPVGEECSRLSLPWQLYRRLFSYFGVKLF